MDMLPISEDILLVKNNNGLWFALIIFGILVFLVMGFVFIKPRPKSTRGYLKIGNQFVNVGDFIFAENEENFSRYLVATNEKLTIWEKQYIETYKYFILKTEIDGVMYSFINGSPGYDALFKICSLSPLTNGSENIVIFEKNFQATENVWSETESKFLSIQTENILFWNATQQDKLKLIPE